MALCTTCGADNPDRAKFCLECGAAMATAASRSAGARKLVTVLFADVVGSTALGEQLDPETMRAALARYFTAARAVLERHGGTVEKFIGDAVMAVFGVPLLHEDDALRGVRAAVELRDEIARLNESLAAERRIRVEFRIGVNTGMVVAGGGEGSGSFVTGDAVNVAARLEQAASPGEVLIGDSTYRLVRDHVTVESAPPVSAKGKSDDLRAHRLLGLGDTTGSSGRQPERRTSFVGRRRELTRLAESFEDSVSERRCFLFTLLGSAGVGKSRLVGEFIRDRSDDAIVLRGRVLPYGEGITYWAIGEIVRAAITAAEDSTDEQLRDGVRRILGDDQNASRAADVLLSMVGASAVNASADERAWAVRRFVEALARTKPVICVVEDVHWAEPALLDLLEGIADWTRDAPVVLLCTARPELLEQRPTWGGGKTNATTILLEPLNADATRELVTTLLADASLSADLADRILTTSEGNPLFAEEIVRMLADDGHSAASDEGPQIPTSVQAVIAARLDRLPAQERTVAERASIAGRVFERSAVIELVRENDRPGVPGALLALMRKELVQPSQPDLTADEAFRFRHMLIRDTAYEGLAKQERADLHERFAGWVGRVAADRADEYAEIVGYHLDLAARYRRELGLDDDHAAALVAAAGERWREAGDRAYARGDKDAATKLFGRAASALPRGHERRRALIRLAQTAGATEWLIARDASKQLAEEARADGDADDELKAFLLSIEPRMFSDESYPASSDSDRIKAAIEFFAAKGDLEGMTIAEEALGLLYLTLGQWENARRVTASGLAHALAAGDSPAADSMRFWILNAGIWGPMPVLELLPLADELISATNSQRIKSTMYGLRGLAHAWAGQADEARADFAASLSIQGELGDPTLAWVFSSAPAEAALGDLDRADENARWNIDVLERLGETGQRSTMWGFRARNRFDQGAPDEEIIGYAEECRRLAASDDMVSQLQWRAATALVAARAGRHDEAKRWQAEAEQVAADSDFIYEHALTAQDRGYIHAQAGEIDEARAAYERARALFEQKGDVMDAARARERLAALTQPGG